MTSERYIQIPSLANMILVFTPLLLSLLPIIVPGQASKCAFVILWVAVYWITGCLSMGATSFISVVALTAFQILTLDEATGAFFFTGIWLFIGSISMAVAAQTTKLHLRVSLKLLTLIGSSPKRLLLGFMITTYILSMWMPNTVVTAMMIPIVEGVLEAIKVQRNKRQSKTLDPEENYPLENNTISTDHGETTSFTSSQLIQRKEKKTMKNLQKGLTICVPYASSIGGVSTVTGSAVNIIAVSILKKSFPDSTEIGFGSWFFYCAPAAFFTFVVAYFWIMWVHFGISHPRFWCRRSGQVVSDDNATTKKLLNEEYSKLGPLRWDEKWVLGIFVLTTCLWFTRRPGFVTGWSAYMSGKYVNDGVVCLAMLLVLFFIPKERPSLFTDKGYKTQSHKKSRAILTWADMQQHFLWEVLFIFGGGLILAEGAEKSGLSYLIGNNLQFLTNYQPWVACLCLSLVAMVLTECTSNTAVTNLLLPILIQVAITVRVHPFYMCLPPVLSTSLAFMLPVATPPNVIAYNSGYLKIVDMVKTGWFLNIVGVFFITLSINTYGMWFFDLGLLPEWANVGNFTEITTGVRATPTTGSIV